MLEVINILYRNLTRTFNWSSNGNINNDIRYISWFAGLVCRRLWLLNTNVSEDFAPPSSG